jgi:nucleotide-binding universal stress UspA family protein
MRILIAADESAQSVVVLDLGVHVLRASRFGETLTILTVVPSAAERPRGQRVLAYARDLLEEETSRIRTKIRIGNPVEEIVKETTEHKYDLLIIGMRPEHGLMARLRGSTTMQIIEKVSCSVAIAKEKVRPLRHLLLCDSGAHTPSLVSHFLKDLGSLLSEEVNITVLHVMSQMSAGPQISGEHLRADAETLMREHAPEGEWLSEDLKLLQDAHIHSRPKVRHGLVVEEILDEAHTGDYDMVVIGAHQYEGWTGFLLDNLARQIITQIDRPVLLVRWPDHRS